MQANPLRAGGLFIIPRHPFLSHGDHLRVLYELLSHPAVFTSACGKLVLVPYCTGTVERPHIRTQDMVQYRKERHAYTQDVVIESIPTEQSATIDPISYGGLAVLADRGLTSVQCGIRQLRIKMPRTGVLPPDSRILAGCFANW